LFPIKSTPEGFHSDVIVHNDAFVKDLNTYQCQLSYNKELKSYSGGLLYKGIEGYKLLGIFTQSALALSDRSTLGIHLQMNQYSYGSSYRTNYHLNYSIAYQLSYTKKLKFRILIMDPYPAHEYGRTKVFAGIQYELSDDCSILGEIDQGSKTELKARLGIQYQIQEFIVTGIGISVNPGILYFGTLIKLKNISFAIASYRVPHLGFSNRISIHIPIRS
jgi:hypothetical protein